MTHDYSTAQPPIPRHEVPSMRQWMQRHQEQPEGFLARIFGRKQA